MTWWVGGGGEEIHSSLSVAFCLRHVRVSLTQGILDDVWKYKLIFVETPDANETSIALENYRRVSHS